MILALEDVGTVVQLTHHLPYCLNPGLKLPNLQITNNEPETLVLSWIIDPNAGILTLEASSDLQTWRPLSEEITRRFRTMGLYQFVRHSWG
ncbi:MAG: hypothetical protein ACI8XO_003749 [Verrucomicrobiales bacterium]|jgi:hypothetical protein